MLPKQTSLFLGVPLTGEQIALYHAQDPQVKAIFVSSGEAYLEERLIQGDLFLGREVGKTVTQMEIENISLNLLSLLKKLSMEIDSQAICLVPVELA